jgi:hypothetical protein
VHCYCSCAAFKNAVYLIHVALLHRVSSSVLTMVEGSSDDVQTNAF